MRGSADYITRTNKKSHFVERHLHKILDILYLVAVDAGKLHGSIASLQQCKVAHYTS